MTYYHSNCMRLSASIHSLQRERRNRHHSLFAELAAAPLNTVSSLLRPLLLVAGRGRREEEDVDTSVPAPRVQASFNQAIFSSPWFTRGESNRGKRTLRLFVRHVSSNGKVSDSTQKARRTYTSPSVGIERKDKNVTTRITCIRACLNEQRGSVPT